MKEEFRHLQPGDKGYWAERSRTGQRALREHRTIKSRRKNIESPEKMWEYACQYFERVDNTPLYKKDFLRGGANAGDEIKIAVERPYTWSGFNDFLFEKGIIVSTQKYKSNYNGLYPEYVEVVAAIDSVMTTNKFDGAMVGNFNAGIASQALGLISKSQTETHLIATQTDPIDYSKLSTEALEEISKIQQEQKKLDK